jgi:hypothetical protein
MVGGKLKGNMFMLPKSKIRKWSTQKHFGRYIPYKESGYFDKESKHFCVYFTYWNPVKSVKIELNPWRNT